MSDLVSSVPGIWEAFWGLIQSASYGNAAAFPFEIMGYEPGSYVILGGVENHTWEWEAIGSFSQKEHYDIVGKVTVFEGSSLNNNPSLATSTMNAVYSLFQTCVMTPAITNRNMPIFGTTGPTPYQMYPQYARYTAGPGNMAGAQAGWEGTIEFSFHFDAYITPA